VFRKWFASIEDVVWVFGEEKKRDNRTRKTRDTRERSGLSAERFFKISDA